uniref:Uncharacterized protein n=1 Tax=Solanum lycopersicum TaxID=4081 RepID=K4CJ72_SOLLC
MLGHTYVLLTYFLISLFEYEIQSWKYSIPLFFTTQGFDTFRNRKISTGAGAIREQLADLDLRIIIENSLVWCH